MSPWRRWAGAALALAALLAFAPALAVEPDEMLKDPAMETRAEHISQTLRCVVCQNQNIDDSAAPLAGDMRRLVRERLMAGDSDDQVRAYFVARYGNFVLLEPPFQSDTAALWLGPLLVLLIAGGGFWLLLRRRAPAHPPAPLTDQEQTAIRSMLDAASPRKPS
jgi:cytochrome c-type biogenesis protein CcmH